MYHFLLISLLLITANVNAKPLEQQNQDGDEHKVTRLRQDFKLVAYVENFKNIMAEYVSSEYRHLTINEVERVKATLEQFLHNFAKDLKEILDHPEDSHKFVEGRRQVDDGISDATFEEIKQRVMHEFPDIDEEMANEIVYRLRKNLLWTREKLDHIIEESRRAKAANS
ncbi:unnamed protein product [Parnassius apollo]|uniref:(apollo) hypothetical protein n=1 Tax=Parnassius apollo TaxID=110799 RepID=A0A8S3X679_PARAO|nr:unnamed protein product [Parnassius apollo]